MPAPNRKAGSRTSKREIRDTAAGEKRFCVMILNDNNEKPTLNCNWAVKIFENIVFLFLS